MSRLFVIEAPGKIRTFDSLLEKIDFSSRIQATKGHIFHMPEKLDVVGIDCKFRDFERKPRDINLVERIRSEAKMADEVYIATDADSEGDVIAWDVVELIKDIHPSPSRVRLKGMDEDSVRQAIVEAVPVRKLDAVGGRTRAIVDRLIGSAFSKDGVAVGRVGTALLGLVDKTNPSIIRLRLVAPAKDGGRPWVAETDCVTPLNEKICFELSKLNFPTMDIWKTKDFTSSLGNMGDVMVRVGDSLDMSPKESAQSLQRLYESGRMSYPRSGSKGISDSVARKMTDVLRKAGYGVEAENYSKKSNTDVHDSPYPIGSVDLKSDPRKLSQDDSVRASIARDYVKCGLNQVQQVASSGAVYAFLMNKGFSKEVSDFVSKLEWRREVGPRYPGQESWPVSKIELRRPDVVLLEKAVELGLGRPSTWANHIDTFMNRGLVDEDLVLTEKGRQWIENSPSELLDPRVSAAIEKACERVTDEMMKNPSREPWELNAERIIRALPLKIRNSITALIDHEKPREKVDPVEKYGLNESIVEDVENRSDLPVYAPAFDDY